MRLLRSFAGRIAWLISAAMPLFGASMILAYSARASFGLGEDHAEPTLGMAFLSPARMRDHPILFFHSTPSATTR